MPPAPTPPSTHRLDKLGLPFEVRAATAADHSRIRAFYEAFEPKGIAQGLPPRQPDQRTTWLADLLQEGLNLVAAAEEGLVGHACLMELAAGRCGEYLVFVGPTHQNRGVGTALTEGVREVAQARGYERIWLTVEVGNRPAIRVYEKAGFRKVGPPDLEWDMVLDLSGAPRA